MRKHKTRFGFLMLLLLLILLLSACGKAKIPLWLPEDLKEVRVVGWTADFSAGELAQVNLSTGTERLTYHPGESPTRSSKTANLGETQLVCGQLPGVLDGISDWVEQNQPQLLEQEFSCSFVDPRFYFQGNPKGVVAGGDGRLLTYSLSDGKISAVSGGYAGSESYGAVTLFTQDGIWNVLIDQ